MSQFPDKSYLDQVKVILSSKKEYVSMAAIDAFGKRDEDSEKFLRDLLSSIYHRSLTSRKDFEKDLQQILKEVCDEADRFQLHYGGNSGDAWRERKYPGKKWGWDWDSAIPKKAKNV